VTAPTIRELKLTIEARAAGLSEPLVLVITEHCSNFPSDAGRCFALAEAVQGVGATAATLAAALERNVSVDAFIARASRLVGPTRRVTRHRDAALRRDLMGG
jgi:hypothetical protein